MRCKVHVKHRAFYVFIIIEENFMGEPQEKILVVDDEKIIINVFKICLAKDGNIESAGNGGEALEKLDEKYYSVIITDVDMPAMNGIEFYFKAVEKYPSVKKRFLFYTGQLEEYLSFFTNNDLKYLPKPSQMKDIKKVVTEILAGLNPLTS